MENYFRDTPLPSGWTPSLWDRFWEATLNFLPLWLRETVGEVFLWAREIWAEYTAWILLIVVILAICKVMHMKARHRERNIQKLWRFTLFFLSKRQMMIPLVYTLAEKDGVLDPKTLQELLKLRSQCRDILLSQKPIERLKLERKISKMLFEYFSRLEEAGKIDHNSKFGQVVKDLEFIDQKLVDLQKVYSKEATEWNQKRTMLPLSILGKIFRFRTFEPFTEKHS